VAGIEVVGGIDADAPPDAIVGDPGGLELPLRVLSDPWAEPAARRVLKRCLPSHLTADGDAAIALDRAGLMPICPSPDLSAKTLLWAIESPPAEFDEWRSADPDAEPGLRAIARWLLGEEPTLGASYAAEFGAEALLDVFLARFDERQKSILFSRAEGRTLLDLGVEQGVSRARIGQISVKALRTLAADLVRAQATFVPAVHGLLHHANALAEAVLAAACEAEGLLRQDTTHEWIRRALAPHEARVLLVLKDAATEMPAEQAAPFDPLSRVGRPLAGGRTSLPWSDDDVSRLRDAFECACGERSFALLHDVAREASLDAETVARLAPLAGLAAHGPVVLTSAWKVADLRGGFAAFAMSQVPRPMHQAEIFVSGLGEVSFPEWSYRSVIKALQDTPEAFQPCGSGLWSLVSGEHGSTEVEDLRPACPPMRATSAPVPPPSSSRERLLEGLDPHDVAFAAAAADRIGTALRRLPGSGRHSVGEVLGHADDLKALLAWLGGPWPQGGNTDCAEVGLCLLAASAAAAWRNSAEGWGTWDTVRRACGPNARRALFNTQDVLEHRTASALLRAVVTYRLRHPLDYRCDPWVTLLRLQWGLRKSDLTSLPHWLRGNDDLPAALRLLAADPSTGMAELWSALAAAVSGQPDTAVLASAAALPWWPCWSIEEVLASLVERPSSIARGRPDEDDPAMHVEPCVIEGAEERPSVTPLGSRLSKAGDRFEVELPARLPLPAGEVVATGDGFRVGGAVGPGGEATWHHASGWLALPLRGPGERELRIETAGGQQPLTLPVQLWDAEAFMAVFDLGRADRTALDPYTASLSVAGPHALLVHEGLAASVVADDEAALDAGYRLLVYRAGFADGFEVACDGQVVWQFQRQEARPLLDVPPAVLSGDGSKLGWGQACSIEASGLPEGFVPSRVYLGSQMLRLSQDCPPWRFDGYVLLPGSDPARLKARVEGRLDGARAAVPAVVHLRRPERGAALRRDGTVRHLLSSSVIDRTRDAGSRLWLTRPADEAFADHVLLEGVRPAARLGHHGALLSGVLVALGEQLLAASRSFNRNGASLPVAAAVLDRGIVQSSSTVDAGLRLAFTSPVSWSASHRVHGWGNGGAVELTVEAVSPDGTHIDVELPTDGVAGVAVSHGTAWLGSAYLRADPVAEAAAFLAEGDLVDRMAFALSARLPLLGRKAATVAGQRMLSADRAALAVLLRGIPDTEREYVAGRVLSRWVARDEDAAALVREFAEALEHPRSRTTLLESLVRAAPCAAANALRSGLAGMQPRERKRLVAALLVRTWPPGLSDDHPMPSPRDPDRCAVEADAVLLDAACRATRTDSQFLSSRAEASIVSLAWAACQQARPSGQPENLATALALPPIRRWIAAHLLGRLILTGF
jgi:hypothetical protein